MLSICVISVGCYGPNPNYLGVSGHADDTGDHASADTEDDEIDTETDTADDTGSTDSSQLAPPNPSCGDGVADAGEFCYEFVELSELIDVQSIAIADLDGDGFMDLGIGRKDDVLVLFGDGTGDFPRQTDLPEPGSNYFGAAAGDLDGDQFADLIVAPASDNRVLVYRSLGGGDFADPLEFATGDNPQRLALARLDRDFTLDLAVSLGGQNDVEVLLGDGAGGFAEPTAFASGGDQPLALGFGLFDQDSIPDLVVGNFNSESLALLRGTASGQLQEAQVHPLAGRPRSTVIADFNLDGRLDVAAALEDLDRIQVLHGDGLGGFSEGVELLVGDRPMGAVAGDFNLDGAPDLLVINRDDASVGLSFGAPDLPGQFVAPMLMVEFNGFAGMSVVVSADLNDDGVEDVVIGGAGIRAMISNP